MRIKVTRGMLVLMFSFFSGLMSNLILNQTGPTSLTAKIEDLLKANSYEVTLSNGSLFGPGLDL